MLATDIFMDVRAARSISHEQVMRLERLVFANGAPSGDQLDLLYLMDTYLRRPDPLFADLLARAGAATMRQAGTAKAA
jgi:hypothetical protein